jgi:5-carboxymethyl-2-hydroxymuconate isomerase
MKLGVFTVNGRTLLGEIDGDTICGVAWPDTNMRGLIQRGITPTRAYERFPLEGAIIRPPVQPGKIIAVGRNYAEHARETGSGVPERPLLFAKLTSALIGHRAAITWRADVTQAVDWEGELAVVIGRQARGVTQENALSHVFGYTLANDVTARDLQASEPQWLRGKGMDTFCPLGPVIVTRDAVPDPQALTLRTTVNGQLMQDGTTADMVFSVAALISFISAHITLEPGDVILTGTPAGVGHGMNPPRYLADGDVVTVSSPLIGDLTNPCSVI